MTIENKYHGTIIPRSILEIVRDENVNTFFGVSVEKSTGSSICLTVLNCRGGEFSIRDQTIGFDVRITITSLFGGHDREQIHRHEADRFQSSEHGQEVCSL